MPDASAPRARDAVRSRAEVLDVAGKVFAEVGYDGARVDEIAARTSTTKRMIYYYFGSKEALYIAVLERAYRGIRGAERAIELGDLAPPEAVRRVAELTFDHHHQHPEFIRLVAIENIHHGEYLRKIDKLRELGTPAASLLEQILEKGRADGTLRTDVDALDVHMLISAYCVFQIANSYTVGQLFDYDMRSDEVRSRNRALLGDLVVSWLRPPIGPARTSDRWSPLSGPLVSPGGSVLDLTHWFVHGWTRDARHCRSRRRTISEAAVDIARRSVLTGAGAGLGLGLAGGLVRSSAAASGAPSAAGSPKHPLGPAAPLDGRPLPAYDFSRANKLPREMIGYWRKEFAVGASLRSAKVYISPETPIRSYYTVVAVPDGVDTETFLWKSGWRELADRHEEGLFLLEPGPDGWQSAEDETAYVRAAMAFYQSNGYFSIFGEHYLVGYASGAAPLEAWAAEFPLRVIAQAYVGSDGLPASYLGQLADRTFDGTTEGTYTDVVFPPDFDLVTHAETVLPTWYLDSRDRPRPPSTTGSPPTMCGRRVETSCWGRSTSRPPTPTGG